MSISERSMRRAVSGRDAAFDGRFVYAVITTGVYCRPSCAARPARPENLRFYPHGNDAEAAGFRPCRRCRPDQPAARLREVVDAARYIEANCSERLTLADLAARAGLSPSRFQRAFKSAFGVTPKAYQDAARLDGFKASLKSGDDVTGAVHAAGFGSSSRVYGERYRNIGMTPSAYRSGGVGEKIFYACRDTSLGPLMMAATARGVCFAQFGESPQRQFGKSPQRQFGKSPQRDVAESGSATFHGSAEALLTRLQEEFPGATLQPSPAEGSPQLDAWIEALSTHLSAGAPRPDLPLDLRGTALQIQVWRFLLSVPEGNVLSYGELAHGIGRPTAVRAVASACAANRVAVLVPCHRVLRADGGLGGYRWGMDRKRTLLDAERARRSET